MLLLSISFTCEDKFYKKKFDTKFTITNNTNKVVSEIEIDANYGVKVWTFKNTQPGTTEKLRFNIKRDIRRSEGAFIITAFFSTTDSVTLNTGYYTNGYFLEENPTDFHIYEDTIVGSR